MQPDDEWNHRATEAFDVTDLMEHGVMFEEPRTLVISLDEGRTKEVVFVLGDHWSMWSAAAFKAWAARLLKQL